MQKKTRKSVGGLILLTAVVGVRGAAHNMTAKLPQISVSQQAHLQEQAPNSQHCAGSLQDGAQAALNYRGDVTITLISGVIHDGYVFDLCTGVGSRDVVAVRFLESQRESPTVVKLSEIAQIVLSGKDPAAGKSWEKWVETYIQRSK